MREDEAAICDAVEKGPESLLGDRGYQAWAGGINSISSLFGLDAKTVRRGVTELELPDDPAQSYLQKEEVDAHPDRNAQIENIARLTAGYLARGEPVLSIDQRKRN